MAIQMRPALCRAQRHKPGAKYLYVPFHGPSVWECRCVRCGYEWTEQA